MSAAALLPCQSGVWKKLGSALTPATVNVSYTGGNFYAASANCPAVTTDTNRAEYTYTFSTTTTSLLIANLSGKGFGNGAATLNSVFEAIYVDGNFCGWDRGVNNPASVTRIMGTASCSKTLSAGSHFVSFCPSWVGIASELDFVGNISVLQ